MAHQPTTSDPARLGQELLGYLNYSSGNADPHFLAGLNELYRAIEGADRERADTWQVVRQQLSAQLDRLQTESPAFRDSNQARVVLETLLGEFVQRYRAHHRDSLFHQPDAALWRPFFLGRVCEAILRQGAPWDETDRIVAAAITQLEDYVGHRPVAVLHGSRRMEPYEHEWVRPIPLYIAGAGVAVGQYRQLVELSLGILHRTDSQLLFDASFNPKLLEELAMDSRAYDFDHPANKRPNYHFGQWDPHHVDGDGRYRRFVVQQVTLDALLERVERGAKNAPREELMLEAAAVLCGTMLMASGTSGHGPDAYDSTTTLFALMPRIAAYRDAFYTQWIAQAGGSHGERLRSEAAAGRQPLAAARQHLNQQLSRRRASQLEHVHVALLYARMGYSAAALRQAHVVPVASARMLCEIQCRLTTAGFDVEAGRLDVAAQQAVEIEDFIDRGIQCGALVDPWNILGFQGQFSLFPSPENSVTDHRIEQLVELLEQLFDLYARLWSEAAARDDTSLQETMDKAVAARARWWDQFASTTVADVESFSGAEAYASARGVAETLQAWHQGGAATGDVGFWRGHVQRLNSPKAFARVVETLLDKGDLVAARALLMQWLSLAGTMPLAQGEFSFYSLAQRWLYAACYGWDGRKAPQTSADERTALVRKFFDYLEANAEDLWNVPQLETTLAPNRAHKSESPDDTDDDQDIFSAAYDNMVYVDSSADGIDADMLESGGSATDGELEAESRRLQEQLHFLRGVAALWKIAASAPGLAFSPEERQRWSEKAASNYHGLLELLGQAVEMPVPQPTANRDSLLDFDRRRSIKHALIHKIIEAALDSAEAARCGPDSVDGSKASPLDVVYRAIISGNATAVREAWPRLAEYLRDQTLLYVPVEKGGDPRRVVAARALQQTIRGMLEGLPRLGLLREGSELIGLARSMEGAHPIGPGAVSEFDRLFKVGFESLVESLVAVSDSWGPRQNAGGEDSSKAELTDPALVECVEQITQSLLQQWLAHSRTLRLSSIEKIPDEQGWQELVHFIERYGEDLFTQNFMNFGSLRAILHQGVDRWLTELQNLDQTEAAKLVAELDQQIPRVDAVRMLTLVIETVVENYAEYRDYNTTTTQSDRGELLYTLLDFLRLRTQYDRLAWHLRPVLLAHEILVRRGRDAAAEAWRRGLAERTQEIADSLEQRCRGLQEKYGMRLPSVSDRLAERFLRPMEIDRMRAAIRPAMEAVHRQSASAKTFQPAESGVFDNLERSLDDMMQQPTGVGLEVPAWLLALEEEVEQTRRALARHGEPPAQIPQRPLSLEDVERELRDREE